jgi:Acyl-CoA reductase (LuxC)
MNDIAVNQTVITVPLIIRGRFIEDNLVEFGGRRGGLMFRTPDVNQYFDQIVLRNPADMRDWYAMEMDEILDYLEELGSRLSPATNPHIQRALEASVATSGISPDSLRFMYENQRHVLKKTRTREMIDAVFGEPYLEQWVNHRRSDRSIKVRAFGSRMVHINPGNGIAIALQSIMNTALLRGDSIIKSPSNDPLTATAIALTMIEMAPNHPLTKHVTVCYWKGGDEAFERRLYRPANIEKIVAWGGVSSMKHVRGYIGPGVDLIALDPKNSCSLIGAEAFASDETMRRVASLLARDCGAFNQEGCANSRTAYVECGTGEHNIEKLNRFGKALYEELLQLPAELSSNNHPNFSPMLRDEIDAIRGSPYFQVIGCKANEGGVLVSQESEPVEFAELLSGRVLNLVPVDKIEDAYDWINIDTQTVSIYPDLLKDKVRDECAWRGAQRLTSLGWSAAMSFSQPHDAIEPLRRMARWVVIEDFGDEKFGDSGLFNAG